VAAIVTKVTVGQYVKLQVWTTRSTGWIASPQLSSLGWACCWLAATMIVAAIYASLR
jgi:hypothetical protein